MKKLTEENKMQSTYKEWWYPLHPYVIAVVLVVAAASLRFFVLKEFSFQMLLLTFFPAVILSALYGGFISGLIASVLSSLLLYFGAPILTKEDLINKADLRFGLLLFLLFCIVISIAAEVLLRAKKRALTAVKMADTANNALQESINQIEEKEKQLGQILETLPVGVWIVNEKGTILSGNETAKKIWGGAEFVGIAEFGIYKGWFLHSGKLIEPEEWAAARLIRKGEISLNEEIEIECFDKSHKIILTSAVPIKDNQQKITGGIIINEDITERKKLEKELAEQQLNNQRLITELIIQGQENEKSRVTTELHENINQTLAAVKIYLDLAKMNTAEKEEMLNKSYQHLSEAIIKVNQLSETLDAPSFPEFSLLQTLEILTEETAKMTNLQFQIINETDGLKNLNKKISLLLYRAVQEQLKNIIAYAKATQVTIALKTADKIIHLSVTDDGIGFNSKQQNRGTGFNKIQSRVQFYQGQMTVTSSAGEGCQLEISVPIL